MNTKGECEICGAKMQVDREVMEGILMGETQICPNQCQTFELYTGLYEVVIGERHWGWTYQTPESELQLIRDEIEAEQEKARKARGEASQV